MTDRTFLLVTVGGLNFNSWLAHSFSIFHSLIQQDALLFSWSNIPPCTFRFLDYHAVSLPCLSSLVRSCSVSLHSRLSLPALGSLLCDYVPCPWLSAPVSHWLHPHPVFKPQSLSSSFHVCLVVVSLLQLLLPHLEHFDKFAWSLPADFVPLLCGLSSCTDLFLLKTLWVLTIAGVVWLSILEFAGLSYWQKAFLQQWSNVFSFSCGSWYVGFSAMFVSLPWCRGGGQQNMSNSHWVTYRLSSWCS